MNRKTILRAAMATLGTLGLLTIPATAEARTLSNSTVGTIEGEYWVAGNEYNGYFRAAQTGECVKVQRKAAGVWRDNVSTANGYSCGTTYNLSWWITGTLATNTEAIRLIVIGTTQVVVLCTSKTDCRQM